VHLGLSLPSSWQFCLGRLYKVLQYESDYPGSAIEKIFVGCRLALLDAWFEFRIEMFRGIPIELIAFAVG